MERTIDLSGRWSGHYDQHSRPHPISLELHQEGASLSGTMTDGETDREASVFEVAAEAGLPPGADERIVAKLAEMFPDVPASSISYVTHLPPKSSIEGQIQGTTVSFLKTYAGAHFGGYKVGDQIVGHVAETHIVHYRGKLSPNGNEIEGRWWIENEENAGGRRAEGFFLLTRAPGSA